MRNSHLGKLGSNCLGHPVVHKQLPKKDDGTQQTKKEVNWFSKQNKLLKLDLLKLLYGLYHKTFHKLNSINN